MLKFNSSQKFYLSTDINLNDLKFLTDNYDILTYKDIVSQNDFNKILFSDNVNSNNDIIKDESVSDGVEQYKNWRKKYPQLKDKIHIANDDLIRENTIKDIVDLFSLAYCKLILEHPTSTWSDFAVEYRNLNSFEPQDKKIQRLTKKQFKRLIK
jgi:hypothetical protein